jgi:hypothetical protein
MKIIEMNILLTVPLLREWEQRVGADWAYYKGGVVIEYAYGTIIKCIVLLVMKKHNR